jgi:hypothetical protein
VNQNCADQALGEIWISVTIQAAALPPAPAPAPAPAAIFVARPMKVMRIEWRPYSWYILRWMHVWLEVYEGGARMLIVRTPASRRPHNFNALLICNTLLMSRTQAGVDPNALSQSTFHPDVGKEERYPPLFAAAENGNVLVCRLLLQGGADPSVSKLDTGSSESACVRLTTHPNCDSTHPPPPHTHTHTHTHIQRRSL